jgi:uncharacterized membrane protein
MISKIQQKVHESKVHVHKGHYEEHPVVRSGHDLTAGERAADLVRNGMGSWTFIIVFLGFMGAWVGVNKLVLAFDAYPFILLNLLLSTMAGLQAGILLIAAKRSDRISSEVANHTAANTEDIKTLIEQNTELTALVEKLTSDLHKHFIEEAKDEQAAWEKLDEILQEVDR